MKRTSPMLAEIKDNYNLTWERLGKLIEDFVEVKDSADFAPVKNTLNHRRMEIYLHEILTNRYTTLDGTQIAPSTEYAEYIAQYQGSQGDGLNAEISENAMPFETFFDEEALDAWYEEHGTYTLKGTYVTQVLLDELNAKHGTEQDVQYSLRPYTEHQKENWKNSKNIVVYENETQFRQFVSDALDGLNLGKKMYFGMISDALAERVKNETGYKGDIANYNCSLAAQEIRKIAKTHGDIIKEIQRGQSTISVDDYLKIPDVIEQADKISLSPNKYNGKSVLLFVKNVHGKNTTVVGVISDKRMDLFVQTMYAGINKGSIIKVGVSRQKRKDKATPNR